MSIGNIIDESLLDDIIGESAQQFTDEQLLPCRVLFHEAPVFSALLFLASDEVGADKRDDTALVVMKVTGNSAIALYGDPEHLPEPEGQEFVFNNPGTMVLPHPLTGQVLGSFYVIDETLQSILQEQTGELDDDVSELHIIEDGPTAVAAWPFASHRVRVIREADADQEEAEDEAKPFKINMQLK